jgi:hypothetical protein
VAGVRFWHMDLRVERASMLGCEELLTQSAIECSCRATAQNLRLNRTWRIVLLDS